MRHAQGLEHAPQAVLQVEAEGEHRQDVGRRDPGNREPRDDVVVHVAGNEARMRVPPGEVHQVVDDEQ